MLSLAITLSLITAIVSLPNPLAAVIEHDVVIWTGKHQMITHHTNVSNILRHMSNMAEIEYKIDQDIASSGINDTIFSDQMLSQASLALRVMGQEITATMAILPHPMQCRMGTSTLITKRSARFHNGWFGAAGEAWSVLTGNLPRSAGEYIDENTNRLNQVEHTQHHFIRAINNTAILANENANEIHVLKSRVGALAEHLDRDVSMIYHKTQADNWSSALRSAVLDNKLKVSRTLDAWVAASKGEITPKLLSTQFWLQIEKIIDQDTMKHHDFRYLLAKTAKITVRVCSTHVYVDLDIPMLSRQSYISFSVHPFVIYANHSYYELENVPERAVFGEMNTWTISTDQWNRCTHTQSAVLCERPKVSELNEESCLFRIKNSLDTLNHCHTRQIEKPKDNIDHVGNVIQYTLFNQKRLALTQCHGAPQEQKELSGSGIIRIPYRCRVIVDRNTYVNRDNAVTQYNNTFQFYTPTISNKTFIGRYAKIIHMTAATPGTNKEFTEIQRELDDSQATFGTLEYHRNHIGYMTITSGTVAALALIAILLMVLWIKCYLMRVRKQYRPRPRSASIA